MGGVEKSLISNLLRNKGERPLSSQNHSLQWFPQCAHVVQGSVPHSIVQGHSGKRFCSGQSRVKSFTAHSTWKNPHIFSYIVTSSWLSCIWNIQVSPCPLVLSMDSYYPEKCSILREQQQIHRHITIIVIIIYPSTHGCFMRYLLDIHV